MLLLYRRILYERCGKPPYNNFVYFDDIPKSSHKKINEKIINKKIINEKKLTAKNSHVQFFSYIYSSTTKILIINE